MRTTYTVLLILLAFSFHLLPENGQIVKREEFNLLDDQKLFSRVTKNNELLNEFKYLNKVRTEKVTYISDGLKVTAYLVYPVIEGKYPGIIYNRGGNREFGSISKSKLAFILARVAYRGYIVIASQYRGNDGGEGREEFGGRDVNDVLNLIPLLKNLKNADGSKIGIFGWSRGGMMTYLALSRNSEIKAAVVGGGIADLSMMKNNRPDMEKFVYSELMPDYDKNRDTLLFERSAINLVKKFPQETNIVSVLEFLNISSKHIAIEINENLVFRSDWQETNLKDGDKEKIVKEKGGG